MLKNSNHPHTLFPGTIIAIVIGNALEWYDFTVYAVMTVYIAAVFFRGSHPVNSLLATSPTFGAAFLMRPLGGLVLGIHADRKSRNSAMPLVILLMSAALLLMSCTPGYATIGIFAPCYYIFFAALVTLITAVLLLRGNGHEYTPMAFTPDQI